MSTPDSAMHAISTSQPAPTPVVCCAPSCWLFVSAGGAVVALVAVGVVGRVGFLAGTEVLGAAGEVAAGVGFASPVSVVSCKCRTDTAETSGAGIREWCHVAPPAYRL